VTLGYRVRSERTGWEFLKQASFIEINNDVYKNIVIPFIENK
jgi:predicted SprT family Zn-dependent metalloprotease